MLRHTHDMVVAKYNYPFQHWPEPSPRPRSGQGQRHSQYSSLPRASGLKPHQDIKSSCLGWSRLSSPRATK